MPAARHGHRQSRGTRCVVALHAKIGQLFNGFLVMSNTFDADLEAAQSFEISPVPEIVAELRAGRLVILVDEEDRENEGDLVMAAEFVTPEAINFMVTHARGLV